jgi:hypothetical protein
MEQIKKHDGYIVPFDIPSESLKKGDILRKKTVGGDIDMFENIVILNSSYCLPPEWVETWQKYYHEEVKQTAVEWIISQIVEDQTIKAKSMTEWINIFEQAKQMEKEQIIESYKDSTCQFSVDSRIDCPKSAEQYYTQTYGNNTKTK